MECKFLSNFELKFDIVIEYRNSLIWKQKYWLFWESVKTPSPPVFRGYFSRPKLARFRRVELIVGQKATRLTEQHPLIRKAGLFACGALVRGEFCLPCASQTVIKRSNFCAQLTLRNWLCTWRDSRRAWFKSQLFTMRTKAINGTRFKYFKIHCRV